MTLFCRIYRTRNLGVMILLIWLGAFGSLFPTLLGAWGKFDLDQEIGSCSILPDENQRSPKVFLFLIAFVLPCCAIIICYARIFLIVRKATVNSRPVEPSSSILNINHHQALHETETLSPDQGNSRWFVEGKTYFIDFLQHILFCYSVRQTDSYSSNRITLLSFL
jgi:hypothetical protein